MSNWTQWISSRVDLLGRLPDAHLGRALEHQYHYASFLLGRAVLEGGGFPTPETRKVWDYFIGIADAKTRASWEFNAFLLTLAWLHLEHVSPGGAGHTLLQGHLPKLPLQTAAGLEKHNNNFTAMMMFILSSWSRRGIPVDGDLLAWTRKRVGEFQYGDGFFFDTPWLPGRGIPSLVYHAKIAAVALLQGVFNQDDEFFKRGRRGVDVLLDLCPVEMSMAYGRSQNSLFGLANLWLALQMLCRLEEKYLEAAERVARLIDSVAQNTGEHGINLRNDNKGRKGFDVYMFSIVYNTYAWAMRLFGDALCPRIPGEAPNGAFSPAAFSSAPTPRGDTSEGRAPPSTSVRLRRFGDSGFVSVRAPRYALFLNIVSYNQCDKYYYDPRHMAGVPAAIRAASGSGVPGIPTRPEPVMFWGEKSLSTLIRQKVFGLRNAIHDPLFRHGPDRSGFLPYFQSARLLIVAGEARKAGVTENRVDLEFNLVGLPRMLRRQFGVQSPEEANMGVLQWRMAFDEVGISVAWRITLGKPFRGRLAYCNLRLPDADFQADPKRPGWRAAAGVQWRCEPEPSHVEWTPAAGSDLDVLFARAWRSWSGVGEAEGGFRIEFSDEA